MPSVTFRVTAGPHQGEQFVLDSHQTLVVGRAADAQWRLDKDPFCSRYQFRIEANPPACRLLNLSAITGTQVNGQAVTEAELASGDRIECGNTAFEVAIDAANREGEASAEPPAEPLPELSDAGRTIAYSPTPMLPRRLADFELTRELGRGGMGVVYHAIQQSTGREAAVKLIRPAVVAPKEATQLFLREAAILSRLKHPRIVEYLSLGLHEGQMFLAMEYLPAVDFPAMLKKQSRPKQVRLACGIICRVLEALQHAHEQDIVHRDVKPSNILTYKREGRLLVKLADFGLAKNYQSAGLSSLSHENEIRGTVGYMAPEQIINCRYSKPPCDIYGAGACLYHYLSGKLPIATADGSSSMVLILNQPPVSLGEHARELPVELVAAVDRSLAREPGDRFSSAEHMRHVLLRFTEK